MDIKATPAAVAPVGHPDGWDLGAFDSHMGGLWEEQYKALPMDPP